MAVSFKSALMPLAMAVALSFSAVGTASAAARTENFDNGIPWGWPVVNNSNPLGFTTWSAGDTDIISAYEGDAGSFVSANFNSVDSQGTLSNWLILPTSSYRNGDTLSFYTRTDRATGYADTLEVRFSTAGGSDVGSTADSVGTFDTLLLSINPTQADYGYPTFWTQYSVSLSGLTGNTTGAFALRYVLTDAGFNGNNGNFVGIDSLDITSTPLAAVPEMETYLMMAAGLGLIGWMRKRKSRAVQA